MTPLLRPVVFLALSICAGGASAQSSTDQTYETKDGNPSNSPVAYVYVQTSHGVNLYDAASNGKLTLVAGSPFSTSGEMVGSNGKYFITLGNDDLRSYRVESNGGIGQLVSSINTQIYNGSQCSKPQGTSGNGAVLDHTGQNIYVLLDSQTYDNPLCAAYQTYDIASSSGALTFKGAAVNNTIQVISCCSLPSVLGNDKFAYYLKPDNTCEGCVLEMAPLKRESNGVLENSSATVTGPKPVNSGYSWFISSLAIDPTNRLVASGQWQNRSDPNDMGNSGIASFTVDSNGNATSTNTWQNIPAVDVSPFEMRFSPSGKLLATSAGSGGIQMYHFNGAAPPTPYGSAVGSSPNIWHIRWDNSNHLYSLTPPGTLSVWDVTSTSISAAPGSPYTVTNLQAQPTQIDLVVVPLV